MTYRASLPSTPPGWRTRSGFQVDPMPGGCSLGLIVLEKMCGGDWEIDGGDEEAASVVESVEGLEALWSTASRPSCAPRPSVARRSGG